MKTKDSLSALKWLVENRSRNQNCAVKLYQLLTTHEQKIKVNKFDTFAQALVGISFSLWRAVFLADKTGIRAESLKHAIKFLETLIADNAIGYSQDKANREWTFNYYTNNVRLTMMNLHNLRPGLVPKWHIKNRRPRERWEYGQELLETTILNFAGKLKSSSQEFT